MMQAVYRGRPSPLALDGAGLRRFLGACLLHTYPARATVFQPGDPGNRLLFVIKGRLNILAIDPENGQELALNRVNAGDFVGEAGLFVPVATRSVYLRTLEPSEIASIEYDDLVSLMQGPLAVDAPKIMHALGVQLARRVMETSRKASSLALLDVTSRIWRALEDLTREPGAMTHPKGVQIKTSRQEIARMVGCSREMAGRVVRQLSKDGKMEARGKTMVIYR